jgi:hypothetical protein
MNMRKEFYLLVLVMLSASVSMAQKVYTTYLWHMDQPVYWADKSQGKPDSKQFVEESHRLKNSGGNRYPGSSVAHPTNNLQEIFSKDDRVNAYQHAPRTAINAIRQHADAGAQLSISAGLMENIQSLGVKNQWGYSPTWMNSYKEAISWKTSGNHPRLDVVGFTWDHALSPLVSARTLKMQIQAHQYTTLKHYGHRSKGYWPAEAAFSERIIKTLVECGIEWSVVPNSHLARTLSDYVHPYNINGNVDAPNRADQVPTQGVNWFEGTIDGRGSRLAVPYSYQAHKAQYIDPSTGTAYKIDVVPMCNYFSYVDGYSGANGGEVQSKIEPFSSTDRPSILLLAHDGDNAWGGGFSYYNEAVPGFTNDAAGKGYRPTTIQQFLNDHPVPANAIVRVEDGAWVNAESDWGHPQFINWLWPLYSKPSYRFNPDGWTEDARNWAVITATENYVTMAEDLEGGNLRMQYVAEGGAAATNAEKAWHFYFGGLNSGFMYYGKAEDMEVKPSMTGNIAIDYANRVISANAGVDNTAPSVFIPQRFPYNPGGISFGPLTGYQKVNNSSDFHVWTYAYDVSGLANVTLKYRIDNDGWNPIESIHNDTYAGGSEVGAWQNIEMTRRAMAPDPTDDGELNFFILPAAKADLCYAEITGHKDVLIDYYVEATDSKGNVFRTPIQHVYVGEGDADDDGGGTGTGSVSWLPLAPNQDDPIVITSTTATAASKLHWGVNGVGGSWTTPIASYRPEGTVVTTGTAVETPFVNVGGQWQVTLGPFNNTAQKVSSVNFVINHGGGSWDNNTGSDYRIAVSSNLPDPEPEPGGITVSFKRPTEWGTAGVHVWAWHAGGNVFTTWPGQQMNEIGNGWFSYTFPESLTSVNVIFSKAGSPQSVDITGITQSTCYEYDAPSGTKFTVKTAECPVKTSVPTLTNASIQVYPQPAGERFVVELPNVPMDSGYEMVLRDINGREVRRELLLHKVVVFNREQLPSGVYFIQLSAQGKGHQFNSKLILR